MISLDGERDLYQLLKFISCVTVIYPVCFSIISGDIIKFWTEEDGLVNNRVRSVTECFSIIRKICYLSVPKKSKNVTIQ